MTQNLDTRLRQGPLRVRSVWSAESPQSLSRKILRRRRIHFAVGVAAACGSTCVGLVVALGGSGPAALPAPVVASGSSQQPAAQQAPESQATVAQPVRTRFADGSLAELSSRSAKLHVDHDSKHRVLARLTGSAAFKVLPDQQRSFEVRTAEVRVRVLGANFSVEELPRGQAHVLVEQGKVEVAWLGGTTVLESGQGGSFPPPADEPLALAPLELVSEHEAAPQRVKAGRGSERSHARAGHAPVAAVDPAAELLATADAARLAGHPERSLAPLRALCEQYPTDRRAPVAAFALGRVLLDDLARPSEAAAAFQKVRSLWPRGPLAEDALAREVEAWQGAGRSDSARASAERYLARYPRGRHAPAMHRLLSR